jgi:hypothetical protein
MLMQYVDKLHQYCTFLITFGILNEAHRQPEKACQERMLWRGCFGQSSQPKYFQSFRPAAVLPEISPEIAKIGIEHKTSRRLAKEIH